MGVKEGKGYIVFLQYDDVDQLLQFLHDSEDTIRLYRNKLFDFKIDLLEQIRNGLLDENTLKQLLDKHFDDVTRNKLFKIDFEYGNCIPKFSGGGLFSTITCVWAIHIAQITNCYGQVLEELNIDHAKNPINSSDILVLCDSKYDAISSVLKNFIGD